MYLFHFFPYRQKVAACGATEQGPTWARQCPTCREYTQKFLDERKKKADE